MPVTHPMKAAGSKFNKFREFLSSFEIRDRIPGNTMRGYATLSIDKKSSSCVETIRTKKLSPIILAATLIMSNKLIDKQRIKELWEEIKMLDVLDVAREKGVEEGIEEGKKIGVEEGELKATRNLLFNLLFEKFGGVPRRVSDRIKGIEDRNVLDYLFHQAVRCGDMEAFEAVLSRLE